jgi:hypothetical protein
MPAIGKPSGADRAAAFEPFCLMLLQLRHSLRNKLIALVISGKIVAVTVDHFAKSRVKTLISDFYGKPQKC